MVAQRWRQWVGWAAALAWIMAALPATALAQVQFQAEPQRQIYLPLVPDRGDVVTPAPTLAAGTRVYGLLGELESPAGKAYDHYFAAADGRYFALAGETPQIEQQIGTIAATTPPPLVKLWGATQPPVLPGEPQLLVVTGILATSITPTPVPSGVSGTSTVVAIVRFDEVNLYGGPGANYPRTGQVIVRQACNVTGRNQTATWLQLTCGDGQQGWIDARLVEVAGQVAGVPVINVAAPIIPATVTPVPPAVTPMPTAETFTGWRTEIYNNAGLAGAPVAVVDVPEINFNWGSGGPAQTGSDFFSMRFTRRIMVAPGYYQFTAQADDGVRVWVDGRLIVNAWPTSPSQVYSTGLVLIANHDVRVEYYEAAGLASVRLLYAPVTTGVQWQASYYYGITPTGNPAFTQQEPRGQNPLDYNWSAASPRSGTLTTEYWSAVWVGEFAFDSGNYVFRANADDGIRLYLDGLLVLDYWRDGYKEVSNRVLGIGAGSHTVRVEYYQRTGNAQLDVWWYRDSAYTGVQ